MGDSRDSSAVVDSKGDHILNRWWLPLIATVANIYNPWGLHQKDCGVSTMKCKYWNFLALGQDPHWLCLLPYLNICAWDQGLGGRCGVLNTAKTWKTTKMKIYRTILACLKENCFLPYLSRKFTDKENGVMARKQLRLLQYSWILNQVVPGGSKYWNKVEPISNSIKNPHARPVRIPWANHLPLLGSETLKVPPEIILITALSLFDPCTSQTVSEGIRRANTKATSPPSHRNPNQPRGHTKNPTWNVYQSCRPERKMYSDQTRKCPYVSSKSIRYIMIAYHTD